MLFGKNSNLKPKDIQLIIMKKESIRFCIPALDMA